MLGLTDDTGPLPYFPAKLGTPVQRTPEGGREDSRIELRLYEAWRESFAITPHSWAERPEAEAFAELQRGGAVFQVILGEPGAGKTRLLEEWFQRWWHGTTPTALLGLRVPVLVRLRLLETADVREEDPDRLADRLWSLAQTDARLLTPTAAHLYRPERVRLFRPLWLLDGLDELPPGGPLTDWLRAIATLRGDVVATCRTAVWQADRWISNSIRPRRVETLLPLRTDADRARFLRPTLGGGADQLSTLLGRHAALSPLAGNPLLLGLAALLWRETPDFLPASRAEFYRRAVAVLWRRRVSSHLRDRTGDRDRVLECLAKQMELKPEARARVLEDCAHAASRTDPEALIAGLRGSGLLRVDDARETVSFLHRTFQEYYLTASLADESAEAVVERHWHDHDYEEVLALLLSRLATDGRPYAVAAAISWLVRCGAAHATNPGQLHRIGRSPLRVGLHLVSRSGLRAEPLGEGWRAIETAVGTESLRAYAVARDINAPEAVLERLAGDPNDWVRSAVAKHPSTPAAVLERLAGDPDRDVRMLMAENPSTPAAVLERLADDPDCDVWWKVAGNSSMPAVALERLAGDPNDFVRREVARNRSTPAAVLERLAGDPDDLVRILMAGNPSTPAAVLERLAGDPNDFVRTAMAGNPSTPTAALERLAGDPDISARRGLAGNRSTSAAVLERLADDPDDDVRWKVAGNSSMPAVALERLAGDPNDFVRREVAMHPSTPAAVLERLAGDSNIRVRRGVAGNRSTPTAVLERLAGNRDFSVRQEVAGNNSTPAAVLERLAGDPDGHVRRTVAKNPSTLLESLPSSPDDESNEPTRS